MAKKTARATPAERAEFLRQQREAGDTGYARTGRPIPMEDRMAFINRSGKIVRPEQDGHYRERESKGNFPSEGDYNSGARKYRTLLPVAGILGALFLLTPNITGNAVANLNPSSSNILGIALLIAGLLGAFLWMK